jgi:transcriptional regulator with XRE-family HTH domain
MRDKILRAVRDSPGITDEELTRGSLGRGSLVAAAIETAIGSEEIHRASTVRTSAGGPRSVVGYFSGPAPVGVRSRALSGAGLERLRRAAGLSRPRLASLAGVSATQIAHWESGRQDIPAARSQQLRELLASAGKADAPFADAEIRSMEALEAEAVTVITQEPGLPGRRVAERMSGDAKRRWEAIRRAEASGLVHQEPTVIVYGDGRKFTRGAYHPGPESDGAS